MNLAHSRHFKILCYMKLHDHPKDPGGGVGSVPSAPRVAGVI